jgi:organic radical activating enzyme
MTSEDLSAKIKATRKDCEFVVVTGGEPLLQNVVRLLSEINQNLPSVQHVQFETAGTVWPQGLSGFYPAFPRIRVSIVVSPKTPKVHREITLRANAWKYVVSTSQEFSKEDGLPLDLARPLSLRMSNVYISPMDEKDKSLNKANVNLARDICLDRGYRLSLQVHKIIGVE